MDGQDLPQVPREFLAKDILGKRGEECAANYLKERGYRITERNFYCRSGEIDIIAFMGKELVFVEVKAGQVSRSDYSFPEEAVTKDKRQKLLKAAEEYLMARKLEKQDFRFDIVSVEFGARGQVRRISHFENALED